MSECSFAQFGFHSAPNVTDPSLPRVLLIGDSVMAGYVGGVRNLLSGQANVDDFGTPDYLTNTLADRVQDIVDTHGPYDVIHFNDAGLHAFQPGRPPATDLEFQQLMQEYVNVLKTASDRLIWATTTNVTTSGDTRQLDPVNNPTIIWFNENADVVMNANRIPTVDLYGLTVNRLDLKTDQFHWTFSGYQLMAGAVAPAISSALAVPEPGMLGSLASAMCLIPLRRMVRRRSRFPNQLWRT
jgi:lysophospholipase L1-like esterase